MSAQIIAQLVIALGPPAFQLIKDLIAVWDKPTLSSDEVVAICSRSQTSYDQYIANAKSSLTT